MSWKTRFRIWKIWRRRANCSTFQKLKVLFGYNTVSFLSAVYFEYPPLVWADGGYTVKVPIKRNGSLDINRATLQEETTHEHTDQLP